MSTPQSHRETIGFVGLGIMGKPMALNLLNAGYPLIAYNRSPQALDDLAEHGARPARSLEALAESATVVITMLPDSPEVVEVTETLLGSLSRGSLVIDMSTIAPAVARDLARRAFERGITTLDAPVSGGDVGARNGTLSIMVGGAAEAFDRARAVFGVLGSTVTHVGESGAGQVVKACNQIVVALVIEAVSEALVLGVSAGVAPETLLHVLSGGLAANRVMEVRRRNFLEHDFTPGFKVRLHQKDLAIALETARRSGAVLPVAALVDQMLLSLCRRGYADQDHSALLRSIEDLSCIKEPQ